MGVNNLYPIHIPIYFHDTNYSEMPFLQNHLNLMSVQPLEESKNLMSIRTLLKLPARVQCVGESLWT